MSIFLQRTQNSYDKSFHVNFSPTWRTRGDDPAIENVPSLRTHAPQLFKKKLLICDTALEKKSLEILNLSCEICIINASQEVYHITYLSNTQNSRFVSILGSVKFFPLSVVLYILETGSGPLKIVQQLFFYCSYICNLSVLSLRIANHKVTVRCRKCIYLCNFFPRFFLYVYFMV